MQLNGRKTMKKDMHLAIIFVLLALFFGCATKHKVEVAPVEVKPIHITIDVNIRVDRALDNFFDEIDKEAAEERMEKK
jgi:hypothetical protein